MAKNINKKNSKYTIKKRRPRRSTEEIIDLLIDAAVEEFGLNGYSGARTAAIAQRAGVVEPLLFKHFGSKANLFQRAIFKPLDTHYTEFQADHWDESQDMEGWIQQARAYIGQQQDFLRRHARMFMSLIVHESYENSEIEGIAEINGLQEFLSKLSTTSHQTMSANPRIQPDLLARISFATLLSCVLFRDWLIPQKIATDEEIMTAVIDFIMEGVNANLDSRLPA